MDGLRLREVPSRAVNLLTFLHSSPQWPSAVKLLLRKSYTAICNVICASEQALTNVWLEAAEIDADVRKGLISTIGNSLRRLRNYGKFSQTALICVVLNENFPCNFPTPTLRTHRRTHPSNP